MIDFQIQIMLSVLSSELRIPRIHKSDSSDSCSGICVANSLESASVCFVEIELDSGLEFEKKSESLPE